MVVMVDRIKKIMEYYQLAPASFAEQIGINRSNLTHLFSGRNQPSLDLAKKILHCYPDIKTEWLIMGVGEMFRNNEEKELTIKVLNEKKLQKELAEQDLFSTIPTQTNPTPHPIPEQPVANQNELSTEIFDSKPDEETVVAAQTFTPNPVIEPAPPPHPQTEVKKIVFFYADGSFEMFVGR
jgi:transcriptional regulator with XRE-family HTH domain